nr:glycosyltransferase family 1 protein [Paenibacillus sp. GSMTC-2017]
MNRGGAETLLMNLYRHIDRSKLQFDFLTSKEGVFDEEIISLGGQIHRVPYIDKVGHFGYQRVLREFFDSNNKYDVIHVHMDRMSGLMLRASKNAGVPVRIAHSHNTRSEGGWMARLYKRYASLYIDHSATHRFACSEDAGKWLFKGRNKRVELLKNGVDPIRFTYSDFARNAIRSELSIKDDTLVVGHVGRFNHQKNHTQLLDIFSRLLQVHNNSLLILIGDGPLRIEMEKKAIELNIADKVKFLGVRADVDRLLLAFDKFVFPSHHEGLPVTLIEAQAMGIPCIVSDAISKEADLGLSLMKFVSNRSIEGYVIAITSEQQKNKRMITSSQLESVGYDIRATARWIQEYYFQLLEVDNENRNRLYANV